MNYTADQIIAKSKSNVEVAQGLASHVISAVEQLSRLNLQASRAVVAESFEHVQALLNVRDAQEFISLQTSLVNRSPKSTALTAAGLKSSAACRADSAAHFESQVADAQQVIANVVVLRRTLRPVRKPRSRCSRAP